MDAHTILMLAMALTWITMAVMSSTTAKLRKALEKQETTIYYLECRLSTKTGRAERNIERLDRKHRERNRTDVAWAMRSAGTALLGIATNIEDPKLNQGKG